VAPVNSEIMANNTAAAEILRIFPFPLSSSNAGLFQ
jgi:hypothetical protein